MAKPVWFAALILLTIGCTPRESSSPMEPRDAFAAPDTAVGAPTAPATSTLTATATTPSAATTSSLAAAVVEHDVDGRCGAAHWRARTPCVADGFVYAVGRALLGSNESLSRAAAANRGRHALAVALGLDATGGGGARRLIGSVVVAQIACARTALALVRVSAPGQPVAAAACTFDAPTDEKVMSP